MAKPQLSKEHRRRQQANLHVRGSWTYPHREELKRRGFLWDGVVWLAPDETARDKAVEEFANAPGEREWTLTVHGDAGWKDGTGRWAWFCRSHLPPQVVEGFEQGECPSVNIAEARALLWGLRAALEVWAPPPVGGTIFLRSDNKNAIDELTARSRRMPEVAQLIDLVPVNVTLNLKHVPAHSRGTTAAWANNRVDRASNLRGDVGRQRLKEE